MANVTFMRKTCPGMLRSPCAPIREVTPMRFCSAMLFAAVLVAPSSTAFAEGGGLFRKLPKDGSWVRYFMEMKAETPQTQSMSGTFTIRSVGQADENGQKCRWLEVEMQGEQNGKKQYTVLKFLVNEKGFKPGSKEPIEIVRGWKKNQADGEVKQLSANETDPQGMMSMFFGGQRKEVKTLKSEKVVDYQKGRLKIGSGTVGKMDLKPPANTPADFKYNVIQTVWPHKTIPFGTAAMELRMEFESKKKVVFKSKMTFNVEDYGVGGKDAKSALPDKK